jgi:hypothetical protein
VFLFTGFQANAVVIGNLTYDGTYISGDGRTYLGLDTIASWDYTRTFNATQVNGDYEDFRIANTADADYFIGSLFGADADGCTTVDGVADIRTCGHITQWTDGALGDNHSTLYDMILFIGDEGPADVGNLQIGPHNGLVNQYEGWNSYSNSDKHSIGGDNFHSPIPWLLVRDSVAAVPEPSVIALMALGMFGIGLARRRRQS